VNRQASRRAPAKKPAHRLALSRGNVVGPGGRVGQFWTPPWCAELFVQWAGIGPGTRVLDAGCGMGALSMAAARRGAVVRAVEVDERLVERTRDMLERAGVILLHQDLLAPQSPHGARQVAIPTGHGLDVAISNPVWEADYPERFFAAMLARAPRACGIVPLNFLCGTGRGGSFWRGVSIARLRPLPRRPRFAHASGGSGKRDVMFVELRARAVPRGPFDEDLARVGVGE
jgi:SAM-dependent methyltransferase